MATVVYPTPGQLPEGVCSLIDSEQARLNLYAQFLAIAFPETLTGIVIGTVPPVDTTKAWLKQDTNLRPVRIYLFIDGGWIAQHPIVPGFIMIWDQALPDFTTFDGGDTSGIIGPTSGPMWEEATELRTRVPVGVGSFPAPSTTVLSVGDTGGEETHTLTVAETPKHTHVVNTLDRTDASTVWSHFDAGGETDTTSLSKPVAPNASNSMKTSLQALENDDGGGAHQNLQPYYAVYFLRRTARTHYKET